jgi:hypothetical protein
VLRVDAVKVPQRPVVCADVYDVRYHVVHFRDALIGPKGS